MAFLLADLQKSVLSLLSDGHSSLCSHEKKGKYEKGIIPPIIRVKIIQLMALAGGCKLSPVVDTVSVPS